MKRYYLRAISFVTVLALLFSVSGCVPHKGYDPLQDQPAQSNAAISAFIADTERIGVNAVSNVSFSASVTGSPTSVALYNNDTYVADMLDDGKNTDSVAGDGVYTAYITITTEEPETLKFRAQADSSLSNYVYIEVLPLPSHEDAAAVTAAIDELSRILKNHSNSIGNQLLNAISTVKRLKTQGIVEDYSVSDMSVSFVFSSGLRACFSPFVPNTKAVGDGSNVSILTSDPYSTELSDVYFADGYDTYNVGTYNDVISDKISKTFPNYSAPDNLDFDDSEVTIASFGSYGQNQIVMWSGHGGFDAWEHSYMVTGEQYNAERFATDPEYHNKCINGEYITTADKRIAVGAKYINRNFNDLSGSFIFLSICSGGKTSVLADAFLAKGAVAVVSFTNVTYAVYASQMQFGTFTYMTMINPATGNYYTLSEAIEQCRKDYGENDFLPDVNKEKTPSEIIVFGGEAAEGLRLKDNGKAPVDTSPSPSVTQPSQTPQNANNDARKAYKELLDSYKWIEDCPSDLSEIPADQYDEYSLGTYYLCDINNDGTDELIIKAGQSVSDMSMTFYTYKSGRVFCIGSLSTGDAWVYERTDTTGIVICEHHGGEGYDIYADFNGNTITVKETDSYNYELPGYVDKKVGITKAIDPKNVHDTDSLG